MPRLWNAKRRVCRSLTAWTRPRRAGRQEPVTQSQQMSQMAEMTRALAQQRTEGFQTTLRQVHKISGLTQPQALTVITQLEQAEIVTINHNIGDAFESVIILSSNAESLLEDASQAANEAVGAQTADPEQNPADKAAA